MALPTDAKSSDKFVYSNGDFYDGEYKQTLNGISREGQGVYVAKFSWNSDEMSGTVMLFYLRPCLADEEVVQENQEAFTSSQLPDDISGSLNKVLTDKLEGNMGICAGTWSHDLCNGYGHIVFPSGFIYKGEIRNNRFNGPGTILWPSGHRLKGVFEDNRLKFGSFMELFDTDGNRWTATWYGDEKQGEMKKMGLQTKMSFVLE